jgi:hypothetical protein
MKKIINFFLEDSAQEAFIPPLFERLIIEEGFSVDDFQFKILCSRGGGSIQAYKNFIKRTKKRSSLGADALVVGSDGNCNGFAKRREQLLKVAATPPYPVVFTAIPDPHIERWYLLDSLALSRAIGTGVQAITPLAKCEKNHYKKLLQEVFENTDVQPPLGGWEYGPVLAKNIDLYHASQKDHALGDFLEQIRVWLRQLRF